ncbi:MAG: apolipoprotein N-acyltransferase [Terriglobales bacterium]
MASTQQNAVAINRPRTGVQPRALLLAAISGVLQVVIFPSADLSFLCWIAVLPLLLALVQARSDGRSCVPATPGQGFLLGYITGLIWSLGACYWIYDVMHNYGGLQGVVAAGVVVLFSLAMAFSWAVFGLVMALLAGGRLKDKAILLAPFVWVITEMLRGFPFDFRWEPLGTVLVNNIPLSRLATVTGVYGLSFEIVAVNVAFAAALIVRGRRRTVLLATCIISVGALESGNLLQPPRIPANGTARLVQSNIPILAGEQWSQGYFDQTMKDLADLSIPQPGQADPTQPPVDLIVWPETPAPFFIKDPRFRSAVSDIARRAHAAVIVGSLGLPTPPQGDELYNSAAIIAPDGTCGARYDKIHLVPFGEYVPFKQLLGFANSLTHEVGDFIPGRQRNVLRADNLAAGVFICYESAFPDEIRQFAANGAQLFVNISDDAWYGDTSAPWQTLQQTRMRAIEDRRWVLRSTNSGITTVIDPFGRVLDTAPRDRRTYIDVPYSLEPSTTFYTRHGNWFVWLCGIISVVALVATFLPRPRKS